MQLFLVLSLKVFKGFTPPELLTTSGLKEDPCMHSLQQTFNHFQMLNTSTLRTPAAAVIRYLAQVRNPETLLGLRNEKNPVKGLSPIRLYLSNKMLDLGSLNLLSVRSMFSLIPLQKPSINTHTNCQRRIQT
jgi:hypothetical protein